MVGRYKSANGQAMLRLYTALHCFILQLISLLLGKGFEASWGALGTSRALFGVPGRAVGPSWRLLEAYSEALWALLGTLWGAWKASWALLGATWTILGTLLEDLMKKVRLWA